MTFTPTDTTNYTTVQGTVSLTVTKATPAVTWQKPAPIVYGTALSAAQLNATSPIPGKFTYIPSVGAVLAAGTHTPTVTFIPADATNYNPVQAAFADGHQGDAGHHLASAGPHYLRRCAQRHAAQCHGIGSRQIRVHAGSGRGSAGGNAHALGALHAHRQRGLRLGAEQRSADRHQGQADGDHVADTQPHHPGHTAQRHATECHGAGSRQVCLHAGGGRGAFGGTAYALRDSSRPADSNFPPAQAAVSLTVTKATPTITWPTPAAISYGTALSAAQLNAKASVPGSFVYAPAAGEVLPAGTHTLSATFTPRDTADVATAQAEVSLTVAKATPLITWPAPAAISYGTPLSAAQLNATALVPGSFVYTPAAGNVLTRGHAKSFSDLYPQGHGGLHVGASRRVAGRGRVAEYRIAHAGHG